jgi:hypothetical protein
MTLRIRGILQASNAPSSNSCGMKNLQQNKLSQDYRLSLWMMLCSFERLLVYSRLGNWSERLCRRSSISETSLDYIGNPILSSLQDNPWHSVRTLTQELCIPAPTMQRYLCESLRFSRYHWPCVSHMLTDELRQKSIDFSKAMLDGLIYQEMTNFAWIITGDDSQFFFEY